MKRKIHRPKTYFRPLANLPPFLSPEQELRAFEKFHPRAVRLLRKRKPFVVIAADEPYFKVAYDLVREREMENGTWTVEDEQKYRDRS